MNGRILRIYRDGRRNAAERRIQLPNGAEANEETLAEMALIVREDSRQKDLFNFIRREIVGTDKTTAADIIKAGFDFCQKEIIYEDEPDGYETIADLWSCLYCLKPDYPSGDCAIKSTALSTILAAYGFQPYLCAVQQIPNADFYNHVFVGLVIDGSEISLDPTQEDFAVGEEVESLKKLNFQIFK